MKPGAQLADVKPHARRLRARTFFTKREVQSRSCDRAPSELPAPFGEIFEMAAYSAPSTRTVSEDVQRLRTNSRSGIVSGFKAVSHPIPNRNTGANDRLMAYSRQGRGVPVQFRYK